MVQNKLLKATIKYQLYLIGLHADANKNQATIKKIDLINLMSILRAESKKNKAVAIASNQSQKIESYEAIEEKYKKVLENEDLSKRPD